MTTPVVTGWVSDHVIDPERLALTAHEFICRGCNLASHKFTHAGYGMCKTCVSFGVRPPYNRGGFLRPGTSTVHNDTGKPRPIITLPEARAAMARKERSVW